MITITVQQMIGIVNNIMPKLINTNYDAKTAFKVLRLVKALRDEYSNLVEAQRALLDKYGTPIEGEDGKYDIPAENQQQYNKELTELASSKIELNASKIPISCLDGLEITPLQAMDADDIFE